MLRGGIKIRHLFMFWLHQLHRENMKNFTLLFTFLLMPLGLFATDCIPDCDCETDWTLEVRGALLLSP